jgi:phytoene desaturase
VRRLPATNRNHSSKRVAVVGAGPGGLAAAMLLAAQGFSVDVFEKQARVGGRTSRLQLGQYSFDRGPTFFMMPHLLEEIFASVGARLQDYVTLTPLDPLYRLKFGEHEFLPTQNRDRMRAQMESLVPGSFAGYERFMHDHETKFARIVPLLQRPFAHLSDYLTGSVFKALPYLHLTETVYEHLSRYFVDERLKFAFAFQAKYLGMSAWDCPGTFTILSYQEHKFGLFHVTGGLHRLCEAMAEVLTKLGGRVHVNKPVQEVLVRNKRAFGLAFADGERIESDHIVLNADFAYAAANLFAPGVLKRYSRPKLAAKKYSCSTFMMYLGVNRTFSIPHHNIYFAADYRKNVEDMTQRKVLSQDASFYVHNPSALDATMAPPGKSALYVLMPVPNLEANVDWETEKERFADTFIARMEQEPEFAGLRTHIEERHVLTPLDWQTEHDIYRGATFSMAHSLDQMMYFRPHNRFEELDNVFLVGGGTHPGSGLPTIFESAKISARLIAGETYG